MNVVPVSKNGDKELALNFINYRKGKSEQESKKELNKPEAT